MSLLTICQAALEEIGDFEVPGSIVGNANATATQIKALANREGRLLSRRHYWNALHKVQTFTTTASTANYTAPSDLRYPLNMTWWDRANYWPVFGPATPEVWQTLQSGIVTEGVRRWFRFQGGDIYIYPTPTVNGDTIAFEYISDQWVDTDADGAGDATSWQADSDTSVLDEELMTLGVKWRFKMEKGIPYADDWNEYERQVNLAIGRDGGAEKLNMGQYSDWFKDYGIVNFPETGFGS